MKKRKVEKKRGLDKGTLQPHPSRTTDATDTDEEDDYKGIPNQLSVSYDLRKREIHIRSDAGRPLRPLFKVENHMVKLKWSHVAKLKDKNDPYR